MKKRQLLFFTFCFIANSYFAQTVNIPDANFKTCLVNTATINTNSDSEIQLSEAQAFVGSINCGGLGIVNATGVEAFTGATFIGLLNNQLTTIDLSQNVGMTYIQLMGNQLSSLDLSNNPLLTGVSVMNNQLTYLNLGNGNNENITEIHAMGNPSLTCVLVDNVAYSNANWSGGAPYNFDAGISFCPAPCDVTIPDANLKALLVSNSAINTNGDGEIQCSEAQAYTGSISIQGMSITNLTGLEAFTAATGLSILNVGATQLDLSSNIAITNISLNGMINLAQLELPGTSATLNSMLISQTNLSEIDLSAYSGLTSIAVNGNAQLDILNVKNGANQSVSSFSSIGNTMLTCIEVDDATWSESNWTSVDNQVSFSENCAALGLESQEIDFQLAPNPVNDLLTITSAKPLTIQLLNGMGQVLDNFYLIEGSIQVSMASFPAGVYFLKMEQNNMFQSKILIKK